ncbi:hypothetical protein TNCV_1782891 [Trichonephila clavipes]|nr:hypothetical protein TNCV_1782891 [Trichonephila clavipes]
MVQSQVNTLGDQGLPILTHSVFVVSPLQYVVDYFPTWIAKHHYRSWMVVQIDHFLGGSVPRNEIFVKPSLTNVEDGLVNGAIGTLKYIEYLTEDEQVTIYGTTEVDVEPQPSTSTGIRKRVRLWLEFPNQAWANYVE